MFGVALAGDPRAARLHSTAGRSRRRSASGSASSWCSAPLNEIVDPLLVAGARPCRSRWRKARGLPRSAWGTAIAHAGVGLTVIGIAATAWSVETIGSVRPGERLKAGDYEVRLERRRPARRGRITARTSAILTVFGSGRELGTIETMKRLYVTRGMPTTEAGILTVGLGQVYASFGEVQADGSIGMRLYHKPLVLLIWIGSLVMAAGGALSLTDRRLRIGAPARAKAAPPHAVPAE